MLDILKNKMVQLHRTDSFIVCMNSTTGMYKIERSPQSWNRYKKQIIEKLYRIYQQNLVRLWYFRMSQIKYILIKYILKDNIFSNLPIHIKSIIIDYI